MENLKGLAPRKCPIFSGANFCFMPQNKSVDAYAEKILKSQYSDFVVQKCYDTVNF